MMATGMVSTPFPMAPDCEASGDAQAAAVGTAGALPQVTRSEDAPSTEHNALWEEVRKTVLDDVDTKLADKMKDLWSRGNKMLKQIEHENTQQTAKLLEELAQRREKQETLKVEQEHLRTLLTSMVQQFSLLGAVYGGPAGPGAPKGFPGAATPSTPTLASCDASSSADTTSALLESPPQLPPPGLAESLGLGGAFPPLAPLPDFPFDATPLPSSATPLSLVEALGSQTASPAIPVSVMDSLSTPAAGEMDFGKVFSFTLRKADGTDLGINVSHHEFDKVLRVEGVRPEGAVEAWNRQCVGSMSADKAVLPGDSIISVNNVVNLPAKMLEECRDKQLLKFTIMRGGVSLLTPKPTTTLRADAGEFVPGGADAGFAPMLATLRADALEFVPGGLVIEPSTLEAAPGLDAGAEETEATA